MTFCRKILAAGFLVAGLAAVPALGHGIAHWIESNPAYVDRNGIGCCGEIDCTPVDPAALQEDDAGITYRGQRLLYGKPDGTRGGIYWTAEPNPPAGTRPWVCVRNGSLKCIFRVQPQG